MCCVHRHAATITRPFRAPAPAPTPTRKHREARVRYREAPGRNFFHKPLDALPTAPRFCFPISQFPLFHQSGHAQRPPSAPGLPGTVASAIHLRSQPASFVTNARQSTRPTRVARTRYTRSFFHSRPAPDPHANQCENSTPFVPVHAKKMFHLISCHALTRQHPGLSLLSPGFCTAATLTHSLSLAYPP